MTIPLAVLQRLISGFLLILLAACGGGGGNDSTAAAPAVSVAAATPAGIWTGRTDIGRSITGVVLEDGNYWVVYSAANNSGVIAGVVQGNGSAAFGNFSSSNGKDFNLEGAGITDLSVAATFSTQNSFGGRLTYTRNNAASAFTSTFDTAYLQQVSLATVAGSYVGVAGVADGTEAATVTVSAGGVVSGSGTSGCSFTGLLGQRSTGSIFNLSITFRGGICSNGTSTVTGVGYFDTRTGRIFGAALNGARSNGLLFSGQKTGFVAAAISTNTTSTASSFGATSGTVSTTSSSGGCGSRGGPGYRKANGDCASWADYYAGRR